METLSTSETPAAGGGGMAGQAAPAGEAVPANQPQSGDGKLAAILAKQERREILTAAERGYLGAIKRKAKRPLPIPQSDNPLFEKPLPVGEAPADNPLFENAPGNAAPVGAADSPADYQNFDKALVLGAANAICDGMDTATKLWIGHEAKQAGADSQTVGEYQSAVALQDGHRKLLVENSEPVVVMLCKTFKCTPDKLETTLRNCGFFGALAAHSLAVLAVAKSIRESKKERLGQS